MDRRGFLKALAVSALAFGVGYIVYSRFASPPRYESTEEPEYVVVASNLVVPWSIRWFGDGFLVTERPGRLTLIRDGRSKVVHEFNVARVGEAGLLGLELDPDFDNNRYIYLYLTVDEGSGLVNKVLKAKLDRNLESIEAVNTILDGIPAAAIHDGGRMRIGPDGYLYVTTGDANMPELSQDVDSLAGKILRIDLEGNPAPDNPFENEVYSLGHRNPQGLDWDPVGGELYSSEHGPIGHDEINRIVKGGNYGWPIYAGYSMDERYISPVFETGDRTIAPSGSSFIPGEYIGVGNPVFAVACLRGRQLFIYDPVSGEVYTLYPGRFGRLRDVIYVEGLGVVMATSNRDGRGAPMEGDDKLIVVPPI